MTDKKEFIPALGYHWLTSFYDLTIKLTMPEKKFRAQLIDQLDPNDDEIILEFGFGTGQNIILANKRNDKAKLIGVDMTQKLEKLLNIKFKNLSLT